MFAGVGLISLFAGGYFLDYAALPFPGTDSAMRRSYGILGIEIGVFLAVSALLVSIFYSLAVIEE